MRNILVKKVSEGQVLFKRIVIITLDVALYIFIA